MGAQQESLSHYQTTGLTSAMAPSIDTLCMNTAQVRIGNGNFSTSSPVSDAPWKTIARVEVQASQLGFACDVDIEFAASRGASSLLYKISKWSEPTAEIAPWSAASGTLLKLHVPSLFATRQDAVEHFSATFADLFLHGDRLGFAHLSWSPTSSNRTLWDASVASDSNESWEESVWEDAPHPAWNGFVERLFTASSRGDKWGYRAAVKVEKTLCALRGLTDLRLLSGGANSRVSSHAYTFGVSFVLPYDDAASVLPQKEVQIQRLRAADALISGQGSSCARLVERVTFVYETFGQSCAVTLSQIQGSMARRIYTQENATADMKRIVDTINSQGLCGGELTVRFSKPVVSLSHPSDLTADLLYKLAGGAEVLGIRLRNFMDTRTVCAKLRELENDPTFWSEYEHEIFDRETGKKSYVFDNVWRPALAYPFNRTYLEPPESEEFAHYFSTASALSTFLRKYLHPFAYPIDHYLALLDSLVDTNVHTHPAYRDGWNCGKMQAGMLRLVKNGTITNIHVDHPPDASLGTFVNVLSTNFYTARSTVSGKGGELLVYDAPLSAVRFDSDLGDVAQRYVSVNMEPEEGEAIIICPELPHAIAHVAEGARLSINVFLGLLSDKKGIRVWN